MPERACQLPLSCPCIRRAARQLTFAAEYPGMSAQEPPLQYQVNGVAQRMKACALLSDLPERPSHLHSQRI